MKTPSEIAAQREGLTSGNSRFGANEMRKPPDLFPEIVGMPKTASLSIEHMASVDMWMELLHWWGNSTYKVIDPQAAVKSCKYSVAQVTGAELAGVKMQDMYIPGCTPRELLSEVPLKSMKRKSTTLINNVDDLIGKKKRKKSGGGEDEDDDDDDDDDEEDEEGNRKKKKKNDEEDSEEEESDEDDEDEDDDNDEDDNDYNIDYENDSEGGMSDGYDRDGGGRDDD